MQKHQVESPMTFFICKNIWSGLHIMQYPDRLQDSYINFTVYLKGAASACVRVCMCACARACVCVCACLKGMCPLSRQHFLSSSKVSTSLNTFTPGINIHVCVSLGDTASSLLFNVAADMIMVRLCQGDVPLLQSLFTFWRVSAETKVNFPGRCAWCLTVLVSILLTRCLPL